MEIKPNDLAPSFMSTVGQVCVVKYSKVYPYCKRSRETFIHTSGDQGNVEFCHSGFVLFSLIQSHRKCARCGKSFMFDG